MPLFMPHKSDTWDGFRDAVAFPAEDAAMSTPVGCAIAEEALVAHFGGVAGNVASLLGAFRRYRPAIERVASAKYDAEGRPDFVMLVADDFNLIVGPQPSGTGDSSATKRTPPPD